MSDKFVFQNAKIKHMEPKLLTSQNVQRLLECSSSADAYKLITEIGYGAGLTSDRADFDELFRHEEENAVAVLREFNVDGALDAFLIQCDYLNIKAFIKAEASSSKNAPMLMPYGMLDTDDLRAAVISGDVSNLPAEMGDAVKVILKLIGEDKITPHSVDTIVDKAMYRDIIRKIKKQGALEKLYFTRKIDFLNIASFLRCKKLGLAEKFFIDGFIDGGELEQKFFADIFDSPVEILKEKCKYTPYQDIVAKVAESGNLVEFEVDCDNTLLKIWKDERDDMFSVAPIVNFYLTKTTELKVVKLIVAGIKNHVDPQLIRERMRELYA